MKENRKTIRDRVGAIFGALVIAAVLAIGVMPIASFAAGTVDQLVSVTGVEEGSTVVAYKIVKDAGSGSGWALVADLGVPLADILDGINADEANAMAAAINAGAEVQAFTMTANAATPSTYEIAGPEPGAYLVIVTPNDSSRVYQVMVVSADYDDENTTNTAQAKFSTVNIDKDVEGSDGPITNYHVGDVITYTIDVDVPVYPDNATYTQFIVTDTVPEGLELVADSISDNAGNSVSNSGSGNSIVLDYSGQFNRTGDAANDGSYALEAKEGGKLTITYRAKVTDAALEGINTYTNKAELEFTNNPFSEGTYTPGDTVTGHTYGVSFVKLAKDAQGEVLTDAVFTIYVGSDPLLDNAGHPVTVSYDSDAGKYLLPSGLATGVQYTLVETTIPTGYMKAEDVAFTISVTNDEFCYANDADQSDYIWAISAPIIDPENPGLPTTGGPGTLALTVGGVFLIVAGIVLVTRVARKPE